MSSHEDRIENTRDDEERPDVISRREFFRKSLALGSLAAAGLLLGRKRPLGAQETGGAEAYPDLVALIGGEPDAMFDRGIRELGGMRRFVKSGDIVAIKPNMSWYSPPEGGANTNPILVKRVVEHCFDAGARKVYLFDHTLAQNAYRESGIEDGASSAGAQVVPADSGRYYQGVKIPGAENLTETSVHEVMLEADTFINIPVLKHHSSTHMTAAMKNLMGCVYDRRYYHRSNLHLCIAEFLLYKKPALNVIDAYRVMKNGGPGGWTGSEIMLKKMQIISADIVAADSAAAAQAEYWGITPADKVRYIDYAHRLGIGNKNLNQLAIKKISI